MEVSHKQRANGDCYTIIYDPVKNTGSQFNGTHPAGMAKQMLLNVRNTMDRRERADARYR